MLVAGNNAAVAITETAMAAAAIKVASLFEVDLLMAVSFVDDNYRRMRL
jgi:hypothetical protein